MGGSNRQPKKTSAGSMPNAEGAQDFKNIGRRATKTTTRLCELYVAVTMNMDPSLIRFYLQRGEFQKRLKKVCSGGKTI